MLISPTPREGGDEGGEGEAVAGLGEVHLAMGHLTTSLQFHQADLDIATRIGDKQAQIR